MKPAFLLAPLAFLAASAAADVTTLPLFGDHAVLQRGRPIPVWGWADPGEKVVVTLGAQTASTVASPDGAWKLELPPRQASLDAATLTIAGKNTLTFRDILIGDVWLCGGQSNMEMALAGCDAPDDIRAADLPLIRHFAVGYNFAATPQTRATGAWQVCTPQAAPGFSAVGFYFARKVQPQAGVPIGLLRSCVGGTGIELWMSQETLLSTPALEPYARQMRESLADFQRDLALAMPGLERWLAQAGAAKAAGQPLPMPPPWPEFPFGERAMRPRCVTLHNGMIAPLVPFPLRGVLWYQGENNAGDPLYVEKKRAMVADWRRWFGDPDLPFYFVQLAAWQQSNDRPDHTDGWALVREQQLRCLAIPHTGMASALDVGDAVDIHPKNKADVGERLALWALAGEYGKPVEPSGPLFREALVEEGRIRIRFTHTGAGLMVGAKAGRAPAAHAPDAALKRFAIAGQDKVWRWAQARIDGDSVVCSHPDVPKPVAVRYAWAINPEGANLYNRDGLPASPFRTDDW